MVLQEVAMSAQTKASFVNFLAVIFMLDRQEKRRRDMAGPNAG
jgi:hypothetical protein